MSKRITSWGFIYLNANKQQIGAQVGHNGPDYPNTDEAKLLKRLLKRLSK